jgi:HAD superfamily hydrolase (TIGR01509 family)
MKAVIFDMDGVLADSEPLICAAAMAMFKEKGLAVRASDFHPFVGAGEIRYIGGVAEKYGLEIDIESAKKRTYELYLRLLPGRLTAFPGAVAFVKACRTAGLKTAIASSADLIKVAANLKAIGLPPSGWDAVISADDVENRKPAPDIFLAAAAKLKCDPSDCAVIEDAVNGVAAAKAAGMRCIAVAQTFHTDELKQADLIKLRIGDLALLDLLG